MKNKTYHFTIEKSYNRFSKIKSETHYGVISIFKMWWIDIFLY